MHIIDAKLQNLSCPVSSFVDIANGLISRPTLTAALKGTKTSDRNVEARLLDLLAEMAELKDAAPFAPDWSDAAAVREQLKLRRALKQAIEYDSEVVRILLGAK